MLYIVPDTTPRLVELIIVNPRWVGISLNRIFIL